MPLLSCEIPVRGYEIGPDQVVPAFRLLGYVEQLRWETLHAPNTLDLKRFFSSTHYMVVVAQRLSIRGEARVGQVVRGELGLSHVGRTSLEFHHRLLVGEREVARCTATAVYIGPDRRPTPLPPELHDRVEADLPRPEGCPNPGDPPDDGVRVLPVTVRRSDIDLLLHANHAAYLAWAEEAWCVAAAREPGARPAPGEVARCGRLSAVTLEYRKEALWRERLEVHTWPRPAGEGAGAQEEVLGFAVLGPGGRDDVRCLGATRVRAPA